MRRVSFTTTGWMDAPAWALGVRSQGLIRIPAVVAICERDDGSIWLIDAGWSRETCASPAAIGQLWSRALGLRVQPGDDVASQLRAANMDPRRVTAVVATHLHLDHIGGVADFPNAELIATHDEVAVAYRTHWLRGYRKLDLERVQRLRLVRPRYGSVLGFSRSAQLDDEITLLAGEGHTAGHACVLIRHGDESWLHAGDAAYHRNDLDDGGPGPFARVMAYDLKALRSTHRRIRDSEAHPSRPRVVLSHDADAFAHLPRLAAMASWRAAQPFTTGLSTALPSLITTSKSI